MLGLFLYAASNAVMVWLAAVGAVGPNSIELLTFFTFFAPVGLIVSLIFAQLGNPNAEPFSWPLLGLVVISLIASGFLNFYFLGLASAAV